MALMGLLFAARLTVAAPKDYLVDTWRFDDDLPRDGINSIAQGSDGYLWVSSRYGLARFDGMRFANWTSQTGAQFLGYHFANLTVDRFGAVWIATPGEGLLEWRSGRLSQCMSAGDPVFGPVFAGLTNSQGRPLAMTSDGRILAWTNGAPNPIAKVNRWGDPVPPSLCQDRQGNIWFVTYQHKLVRVEGTNAHEMIHGEGELRRNWIALQVDSDGRVWAGTQREVGVWRDNEFVPITSPMEPFPVDDIIGITNTRSISTNALTSETGFWVIALGRAWLLKGDRWVTNVPFEPSGGLYETSPHMVDREGNLWFTTTKANIVRAGVDGSLLLLTGENGLPAGRVTCLFLDHEGSIWAGVEHAGLARLRDRYFTPVGRRQGVKSPLVWAVVEDGAGAIWLGTENAGLQRWQEGKLTQHDLGNNIVVGSVYSLCLDRRGRLWAGTGDNRVFRFENGKFILVWEDPSPGWNKRVYAIYEDHLGQMWFATGMGLFCWKEGNVRRMTGRNFASGVLRVVCEDANGNLWAGRSGGSGIRLTCVEGDDLVPRGVEAGLKDYDVFGLHADPDGAVWICTMGGGLWRHRDGEFRRYTMDDGLPDDHVYSIEPDETGNLWLGTPTGIIRLTRESVVGLDEGRTTWLDCLMFNRTDGLPTRECSGGTQPVISRTRDGHLLFALTEGAVVLSPDRIKVNTLPPPVIVEEVRVDGKPIIPAGGLRTGPGRHVVEFRYTATSLLAPSKVRFKYRLDGVDSVWRKGGASRSAMYSLTSPGDYRFRVIACNNDGVWNETGAAVTLTVPPYFWQTWSFRVAASLAIFLTLGGTIRFVERRKLQRKLEHLEMQQTVEKERARIARDIHDELGSSLTEIGLLSEFAQRESAPPEQVKADVQKIASEARSCTRALDEIVWAVNPRNDTLDGFATYACAYAEEHLQLANIRCRLDVGSPLPSQSLRPDMRHHFFLAFKEALNNIIKHARASEVEICLRVDGNRLQVWINDNGCGFDPAVASTGNGLTNMKERLASASGGFECESAPGRGTRVKFTMKL